MMHESSDAVRVLPVTAFDLGVLAELHAAIFKAPWDQPWSVQSFAEILAMPGVQGWLMISGETPIGFMLARFTLDEGEILLTGIVPQERRRGHAAHLMRILFDHARAAGIASMFLEHAAGNEAAGALYGRFGFSPIGRRRAYYERRGGGREDAITLRCDLSVRDIDRQGVPHK
ncbi:GNAT family N-acetyltransferase [Dongia deserti]|uniref:GNAT family N-acetyltransferase n=1 Tax=Dongia deserti TaxID=2268030 RepID=UPI000E65093B|nr:GNAT family N-acetyltransferase [Dongia deserti]